MRAIAERLARRPAAAAQPRILGARHRAPGARADLDTADHLQRPIDQWRDPERTPALLERIGLERRRLASRGEVSRAVAVVAERLVGGLAAAAERRAEHSSAPGEVDGRVDGVGAVLAN